MDRDDETLQDPSIDEDAAKFDDEQRRLREQAGLETEEADLVNLNEELGIPEGEGTDPITREASSPELSADTEQELKEAREKFVQKFIEDSINQLESEWGVYLDACANKEKAMTLIVQSTEEAISKKAARFVENGGDPDFGWVAELSVSFYDTPNGRKQFVTGFKIGMTSGASETLGTDGEPGEFTSEEETQGIQQAEDKDELNRRKI